MSKAATGVPVTKKVVAALQDFLGEVPSTRETAVEDPVKRSRQIAVRASARAAAVSGVLAMPPGPLGMLTIIPDLVAIWKIQGQMVADIAGAFGKQTYLSQEQMLYCLFRHTATQAMKDIVVRVGERLLVRKTTLRMMEAALQKIGVRITQRLLNKSVSRWIGPLAALVLAGYSYYDTARIAETTIEFFESDLVIGNEQDRLIYKH